MKSHVQKVLLLVFVCVFINAEQLPDDNNGNEDYNAYNLCKTHVIHNNHQTEYYGYEPPCPNAEDIAPCVCLYDSVDIILDLDCSEVESEDQLKQIFNSDFPVKKFRKFTITNNKKLTMLESYVFNNVNFEMLEISNSELKVIEMHALDSCYETAHSLVFYNNKITLFPLDDLSRFSKLKYLDIAVNLFSMIPTDAFNGLTTLESLRINNNTQNIVGTFEFLPNLKDIHLGQSGLTTIPYKFINTGSSNLKFIGLYDNHLADVEPDAFDIVEGMNIDVGSNYLSTLEEATWRPLLEAGGVLLADNNPLSCGCDIAWLFNEDYLVGRIYAKCSAGENIQNLDPSIFDNC